MPFTRHQSEFILIDIDEASLNYWICISIFRQYVILVLSRTNLSYGHSINTNIHECLSMHCKTECVDFKVKNWLWRSGFKCFPTDVENTFVQKTILHLPDEQHVLTVRTYKQWSKKRIAEDVPEVQGESRWRRQTGATWRFTCPCAARYDRFKLSKMTVQFNQWIIFITYYVKKHK